MHNYLKLRYSGMRFWSGLGWNPIELLSFTETSPTPVGVGWKITGTWRAAYAA